MTRLLWLPLGAKVIITLSLMKIKVWLFYMLLNTRCLCEILKSQINFIKWYLWSSYGFIKVIVKLANKNLRLIVNLTLNETHNESLTSWLYKIFYIYKSIISLLAHIFRNLLHIKMHKERNSPKIAFDDYDLIILLTMWFLLLIL